VLRLARKAHLREDGDAEAERLGIDLGMVTPDKSCVLEGAHPPQARRCRDAGPLSQIDIGHPAVPLQITQDSAVNAIKLATTHEKIPNFGFYFR
jgi:hypothetical protein